MDGNWNNERSTELDAFSGKFFDIPRTALHEDIGLRCYFTAATVKTRFTIVDVQLTYDGSLAYRVVADDDVHKFGCPARPEEVTFVNGEKTFKALFNDSGNLSFSYFDSLDAAIEWILSQYTRGGRQLKQARKGETRSFTGKRVDTDGIEYIIRGSIVNE